MNKPIYYSSLQLFIFLVVIIGLSSCAHSKKQEVDTNVIQTNILPPHVTILVNLPDSIKPKQIFLDRVAKPLTFNIPTKTGGSYTVHTNSESKGIKFQPPIVHSFVDSITHLPVEVESRGSPNFTTFTTGKGLALDAVACGFKDMNGNLWFGTYGGGVSKYDGHSFTTFSTSQGLANNTVFSITQDKKGNIWFGTDGGGVSKYDGHTFTTFSTSQGLADNTIRSIKEDKHGNIWFGTDGGGVCKYDGNNFTTFSTSHGIANNTVFSILEDKTGNLWFGTDGGGVSKYDGNNFTTFSTSQGLANNTVSSILEDKTGNLWFGTDGGGVSKYDGHSFSNFSTSQGLANNTVFSITQDKTGDLWFGTGGGGVSKYDGHSFTTFSTSRGLANNMVFSITQDKTGNLWFGTYGGGVIKYDGHSFTTFSTSQGLANNMVFSILQDKTGNLWFGTDGGGVSKYDEQSFTTFSTSQGLANNTVYSITQDKSGNFWFGTEGEGVSKYDGYSFTTFSTSQGLANNTVFSILEDKTGNLWFGTYGGGVSKYDGHSFTTFTTAQGLANNTVWSIIEDKKGNLWFGTDGGGVSKYDGHSFTTFSTSQGLVNNTVMSILEDKTGNLWFSTDGGVSFLSRETLAEFPALVKVDDNVKWSKIKLFENITIEDDLPDNTVTQIVESENGKIYLGTNAGICELIQSNSSEKDWVIGQIFNSAKGYPVKDVNAGQNAMFKDSNGIIWIATGSDKTALVRFDPKVFNKSPIPVMVLNSVKINEENICWNVLNSKLTDTNSKLDSNTTAPNITEEVSTFGIRLSDAKRDSMQQKFKDICFDGISKWYPIPQNLILPYEHNNITIDFNAIETGKNFSVNYQHKLEGYDKDWSQPSTKSSATFGNIFEGTYTFKVKAQNPDGVWGKPIFYSFKVLPPWWRTWWMYVLYVILVVSIIGGYIKWREKALKRENVILEQKINVATKVIREEKEKVEVEKKRSDELLLNILPAEVAEELKDKGTTTAKDFSEVTVLFTDFKNFTLVSEKLSAQELVNEINFCYSAFDNIITKHGIEKIKTIGDSYMCAGGLPVPNNTNAEDIVNAALEIRDFIDTEKQKRITGGLPYFEIRIGCNTGPVVAGIVGIKKFAYDIWGDTVNIASRMESSGEAGKVNISGSTYELVKEKFKCEHRGKIEAKNKGLIDMYFVIRSLSEG